MIISKFDKFVFESKSKSESDKLVSLLFQILENKPKVKTENGSVEEKIYSLSSLKKIFKEKGKTNDDVDDAIYQISKSKEFASKLKHVSVKNYEWNESIPHYYVGLSESEVSELKASKESASKEKNQEKIAKRQELKKSAARSAASTRKPRKKASKKK